MHEQILSPASPLLDGIKQNVSSAVASGTILIIAGTIALISPLVAGLSITLIVSVMLATGGIGQCMLALKAGAYGRGLLMFIMGLLMTIAGSYMAIQAVAGLASITLILVAYLVVTALFDLVVVLKLRPADGWGWALFNSIVTLLLGLMFWRHFPLSSAWAVGVLFCIKMYFNGCLLSFIGISATYEYKTYSH